MSLRQRVAGRRRRHYYVLLVLIVCPAFAAEPPAVTLAETYSGQVDVTEYWISEKYDGVRGYWNGEQLITRGGNVVHAPEWFTAGWPDTAMDGELWLARGRFADASGIVRQDRGSDAEWQQMHYMVFDLPEHGGPFDARVPAIRAVVTAIDQPWVRAIKQYKGKSGTEIGRKSGTDHDFTISIAWSPPEKPACSRLRDLFRASGLAAYNPSFDRLFNLRSKPIVPQDIVTACGTADLIDHTRVELMAKQLSICGRAFFPRAAECSIHRMRHKQITDLSLCIPSVARPRVFGWMGDDARAHRIKFDIPVTFEQIRFSLHKTRAKAAFP